MQRIRLFTGFIRYWFLTVIAWFMLLEVGSVNAIGWENGYFPGDVVGEHYNGNRRVQLSPQMQRQDQLLTVMVTIKDLNKNKISTCTGTLYDRNKVLTAGHCIFKDYLSSPPQMGRPITVDLARGQFVFATFYTPLAVNENVSVFKFYQDKVFQTGTMYLDVFNDLRSNYVSSAYYEQIRVNKVLPVNQDAIVLKLDSEPQIVSAGLVDPISQIRIANYKKVASDEVGRDVKYLQANTNSKAEIMGFGIPDEEAILSGTLSEPEKLFLNLRSVSLGGPISHSIYYCHHKKDCFQYVFYGREGVTVDDGDSGGPFYLYDDSNEYQYQRNSKQLLGVISMGKYLKVNPRKNRMEGYYANFIQGFSDNDIQLIKQMSF